MPCIKTLLLYSTSQPHPRTRLVHTYKQRIGMILHNILCTKVKFFFTKNILNYTNFTLFHYKTYMALFLSLLCVYRIQNSVQLIKVIKKKLLIHDIVCFKLLLIDSQPLFLHVEAAIAHHRVLDWVKCGPSLNLAASFSGPWRMILHVSAVARETTVGLAHSVRLRMPEGRGYA